jgi:hypothetical protein
MHPLWWGVVALVAAVVLCVAILGLRLLAWPGKRVPNITSCAQGSCATLHIPGGAPVLLPLADKVPAHASVYNPSCAFVTLPSDPSDSAGLGSYTDEDTDKDTEQQQAAVLATAARISTYSFCPGGHVGYLSSPPFDSVGVTIAGRAFQVLVPPAWINEAAADAWQRSDGSGEWESVRGRVSPAEKLRIMRAWGLEDPRVIELAPGVLGIIVSIQSPDKHYIRVALMVVRVPSRAELFASHNPHESHDPHESHESHVLTPQALILMPSRGQNTKNWMAYVDRESGRQEGGEAGRLYFVTHVHPQTVVSLSLAHVLSARAIAVLEPRVDLEAHVNSNVPSGWRGNSALVPFCDPKDGSDALLGIVHLKHYDAWHWGQWGVKAWGATFEHAFALFDAAPPFRVRAVSRPFVVRPTIPHAAPVQFVFCTGLAQQPPPHADAFWVTFGVDDCYEASCTFNRAEIHELLAAARDSSYVVVKRVHVGEDLNVTQS